MRIFMKGLGVLLMLVKFLLCNSCMYNILENCFIIILLLVFVEIIVVAGTVFGGCVAVFS